MHYEQRKKLLEKAQESANKGMKNVAGYYAKLATIHATKMQEANERASRRILDYKNNPMNANQIDLHFLHVNEAIQATKEFLSERQKVLVARGFPQTKVSIITGRGAHSHRGHARLKPAIENLLQTSGYKYSKPTSGSFEVVLKGYRECSNYNDRA